MGRRRRKRSENYERFVALPHYMLRSCAWKTLPSDAKALLIDVWMRHNGMNNGEISYSVREAEAIGLSRSVAGRNFRVLIERGFLVVARDSAFSLKTQEARLWRLTMEPYREQSPTKDFMRWSADQGFTKNKSQSLPTDTRSRNGDHDDINARKLPLTVPELGLYRGSAAAKQSLGRDISNLPGSLHQNDGAPPSPFCAAAPSESSVSRPEVSLRQILFPFKGGASGSLNNFGKSRDDRRH